jgi:HAD superfamily hydrolase (TIGR01509 family)
MIELVIFDCDGVLIDSEVISSEVLIQELALLGITIDRAYVRQHFLGRSFPTVARIISERFAMALPTDFEQRYRGALLQRFENDLRPTEGVKEALFGLTLPKCVATSSSPPRVTKSLEITGLREFFGENVFTASLVERGKPFPDLFLYAAQKMSVEPGATLVIEDSLPGIMAAQAAGMAVVGYVGGSHLKGSGIQGVDELVTFDNWKDLPQVLENYSTRSQ